MHDVTLSPLETLANIRRIMSGRPRIETFHALRHISFGIPTLDQESRTRVETMLSIVRRECRPALEDGFLNEGDVYAITLARIHAHLLPPGTPTIRDAHATRLAAAGLLLLTHGPDLVRCGLAPDGRNTVDETLEFTDRAFHGWMREATRSAYALDRAKPGRDAWLAAAANWAYYQPGRATAARYWHSDLRRIAKLLRARGCVDVDAERQAIEGALWQALEEGPIEGLMKWSSRGGPQVHARRIRDIVEASFAKPGGMYVPSREEPAPAHSKREAKRRDRARRQAMRVRDVNAAADRKPTTEDIPVQALGGGTAFKVVPTYAISNDVASGLRATDAARAVRKALDAVAQVRRSDDRVTPAARQYFEALVATGERPSQAEIAQAHDVDPGSLCKRIDRMEQDLKAHEALRDWRGWQATG